MTADVCSAGTPGIFPIGNPIESHNRWEFKKPQMTLLNSSLANFVEHELPELLKREQRRSIKMAPGEFVCQTRETHSALFIANCCIDETFDSKRCEDKTGRMLHLTNAALTAGVEITEERIAAHRAAREGDKTCFASADEGSSASVKKSPRQQARDSVCATGSFCCVVIDDNKNLVGNCPKCMKKMGWDCPSVLNARKITKGCGNKEDPKSLMCVCSAGSAKKSGNSQSQFLSGKNIPKSKAKRSTLLDDPAVWLAQRTNNYLCNTCLRLMILPRREAGAIGVSKFQKTELVKQLLALADDPKVFRKNQEDQRQADRELGACGCSDFISELDDTRAQTKQHQEGDEKSGFAADKKENMMSALPFITQEDNEDLEDDDIRCDSQLVTRRTDSSAVQLTDNLWCMHLKDCTSVVDIGNERLSAGESEEGGWPGRRHGGGLRGRQPGGWLRGRAQRRRTAQTRLARRRRSRGRS